MDIIWTMSRYILPAITVIILIKCILTLMLGHPKEKIYGYIIDMKSGNRYPLNMWETSVGRSKSCDVVLPYDTVSRSHAVITRRIDGWYIHDLLTKARLTVNGEDVEQKALIKNGDIIYFGKHRFRFEIIDDPVQAVGKKKNRNAQPEPKAPARSRPSSSAADTYSNDAQLRKRTSVASSAKGSASSKPSAAKAGDTAKANTRPVPPPAYTGNGNIYNVETASRQQPARRTRKQPRIVNKDTGEVFILCGNEVTIGSSRKCDIRLNSGKVEKMHSLLVLYEDGWAIEKGKGRALLNGVEVKSPQLLFDGDIIALNEERLYYHG